MRIAVVHNLPAGGAKRTLYEQLKRLSKRNEVDVFTFSSTDDSFFPLKKYAKRYYEINFDYPKHFPLTAFSVYWSLRKAYRQMAEIVNSGKYDVAYVAPCFLTQAPYILRYLKIPSAYFCPEPRREFYEKIPRVSNKLNYFLTYPFRYLIKKIDFDNTRQADMILTLSHYNKTNIDFIYGIKSQIIPLGVDTRTFHPVAVKKDNQIITVGNFNLLKGHDFIIRCLALIPTQLRPKLLIAGFGGVERIFLQDLAKRLNVDLSCFDSPSDHELNLLYNRSKFLVFAPIKEPFGLVVLEAWACGLKLLAVNDGGVPELLTEKYLGLTVNRREKLFSQAILRELSQKEDNKLKMLRRQYVIDKWNWEIGVRNLESILYTLVKKNKKS